MTEIDIYFKKQDEFKAKMIAAYDNCSLPHWFLFKPYFEWKKGLRGCDFKVTEIYEMRNIAMSILDLYDKCYPNAFTASLSDSDTSLFPFENHEKDSSNYVILNAIIEELTKLLLLLK